MANRKAVEVTEPEVIDIPLLEDCIIVTGGEEMAAQSKSLPFKEVDWLKLSFKSAPTTPLASQRSQTYSELSLLTLGALWALSLCRDPGHAAHRCDLLVKSLTTVFTAPPPSALSDECIFRHCADRESRRFSCVKEAATRQQQDSKN